MEQASLPLEAVLYDAYIGGSTNFSFNLNESSSGFASSNRPAFSVLNRAFNLSIKSARLLGRTIFDFGEGA